MMSFLRSIGHAWNGLCAVFGRERNFRLQCLGAGLVLVFATMLGVSRGDMLSLILSLVLVLVLEIVNSAVEQMLDSMEPRLRYHVQVVKDVMASAVLLVACSAVVLSVVIFYPYLIEAVRFL